ncbi:hypothetical protein [Peribacillus frigoritolerans]|uniref:hypothetical protein n=1 Tax=Peribacillus frigoritolerans TaxID=450367 RepID=UPI001F4F38AF|nr:hypothetical protein [Peribacillus frigoritolerans]MCK2018860.1 hypothetical protein [Peribacillus frigoritolerans]
MSKNEDRLQYIRDFYANQKVKIEIKEHVIETAKGRQVHRYNGTSIGYKFSNGFAEIDRKDLHKFIELYPHHLIVHDQKEEM